MAAEETPGPDEAARIAHGGGNNNNKDDDKDSGAKSAGAAEDGVIYIGRNPIDNYAMEAIQELSKNGNVILRSKGRSIPTAVTVANIVTREVLKGKSRVRQILLDTDAEPGIGSMTSTIEIRLDRV